MMLKRKSESVGTVEVPVCTSVGSYCSNCFLPVLKSLKKWKRFLQSKLMIWRKLWKKRVKKMLLRSLLILPRIR